MWKLLTNIIEITAQMETPKLNFVVDSVLIMASFQTQFVARKGEYTPLYLPQQTRERSLRNEENSAAVEARTEANLELSIWRH